MSQNPLDSGAQPSKMPGLKPVLAAALSSLEVQLDQELARYRRTRLAYRTPSQPRISISSSSQPQQVTTITTTEIKKAQPPLAESEKEIFQNEIFQPEFPTTTPPPPVVNTQEDVPAPLKVNSSEELHAVQKPSTPTADKKTTTDTPNSSSIVPAVIGQNKSENLVEAEKTSEEPEDYLESSEALLRSLAEEQPQPEKKPKKSSDRLLSPLGIGSMLLLLMGSLTLGYIAFNPKNLSQFNFSGLFKGNTNNTSDTDTQEENSNTNTQTVAQPELSPIPKEPNLAASEFPEVTKPNDVVGLTPKPKLTPVTTSKPDTTTTTSPKPSPTPQNLNDPKIKPSADGFYHIITENQGNNTFASVRQVVPNAYLSPDGKLIYLGALKTKEQLKNQLQLLESKGIKARVQQP